MKRPICRVLSLFLIAFPLVHGDLLARWNLFSRYFRDQAVQQVELRPVRPAGSPRDGKWYLTERQAIEMALEQNLEINLERHAALTGHWLVERGKGVYDPTAVYGLNWDRESTPAASVLQGGESITNILTSHVFGFRQAFSTGTSYEVNFQGVRSRSTSLFSSLVPAINTQFEVLLRQNLLEGFGRITSDYQIEISRNNLEITEQEFKRRAMEIIRQVQQAYWELQFALQEIAVKEKSLELANTVLEQNQARLEVGTASRLEVIQAEAEAASRREELVRARYQYRLAQDQLIRLITSYRDPREFPGEIVPADPLFVPPADGKSFDQLVAMALELRPEIQQAELEIRNRRVALEHSRNQLRPTLDLVLGYQQFGLGGRRIIRDFSRGFLDAPVVRIEPGGLSDSLQQLFSSDFYGYVVGANLQLPLFNTEARARNAEAQIALRRSQLARQTAEQQVAVQIRQAQTEIEMNRARLEAATAALRFARERLEGEQARFEVGLGTTRELIEAQRDLLQAETLKIRVEIDLIDSQYQLEHVVGQSFDRYNIRLAEALTQNVH